MRKPRAKALESSVPTTDCLMPPATLLGCVLLLVVGCASSPVALEGEQIEAFGPAHVLDGQSGPGDRVVWGGRIVGLRNLPDETEIHLVSYPLDRGDRPRVDREPGVRFVLRQSGFLEPVQYAPGRYLTVLGTVAGLEPVAVDEHLLDQPVIVAERIHLWPADIRSWQARTRFSIGVGISL